MDSQAGVRTKYLIFRVLLLWAEIINKIYRVTEGSVDKSFCVILEWKQVIGHLWNLAWLKCRAQRKTVWKVCSPRTEGLGIQWYLLSVIAETERQKQSSWAWPFKLRRPCLGPQAIYLLNHRISSSGVFLHLVVSWYNF